MFEAVDTKETFASREEKVLRFWKDQKIFQQSLDLREKNKAPLFSIYDGPPFATGLPHYGHLLAGTIKDVIPRYKTMKGFTVPRRFGWDCHGLPIENEIEKAKGLTGAAAIKEFGIAKFNEECRAIVKRYTAEWQSTVERMGRWVSFENTWHTMDLSFMESVWWVFKELYNKGLVYEGHKVMPYSWKLGTTLSNFEASENYKDVDDPSLYTLVKLIDRENSYILVWTTTPWTLVSNLAITAGPDIDYVEVKEKATGRHIFVARSRLEAIFKEPENYEIIASMKGATLKGMQYEPPFSYFEAHRKEGAFRVIVDSFVTTEDGTGFVHTAPGFGEADFYACQKEGITLVCPIDQNGNFTSEVPDYKGRFVKECDKDIMKRLKEEGKVFRQETCRHRYPFCWRSDTPLIYRAVTTWFVSVEKIRDKIVKANEQITWMPEHLKYGRFGKWLEGARDWTISRSRYWGTPIPIWRAEDGEILVLGSIQELEEKTGHKATDLHRHFIDHLTLQHNGKTFTRIPDVFDCWFESGSMPYAQNHYPFEKKEMFEQIFPADFVAEGIDQTRAWFYVLNVLGVALFDKPAFKNVIVNGILLAADGAKMSKRLRNYPDPVDMINKYGADAVRLYMMSSPAVKAEDLNFTERGVEGVVKQIFLPLMNAYSFFITYARLYNFEPQGALNVDSDLDKWMLSKSEKLVHDVTTAMDRYDLNNAVDPFIEFIEQLTNWYIRRSRRRFWSDVDSKDRRDAFETLYKALMTVIKVAAPFVPFITDSIYQNLKKENDPASVHLCDFPVADDKRRNQPLEALMHDVQEVVNLGHALRKERLLKVRQPLQCAHVITADAAALHALKAQKELIAEELNVLDVHFTSNEAEFVSLKAKPNFRVLGKKIGKFMKEAQAAINAFDQATLAKLLAGESVILFLEGHDVTLTSEDVAVDRIVKEGIAAMTSGDGITVALETELTQALIDQGIARECINKINTLRKELNFNIADRIAVQLQAPQEIEAAIRTHEKLIAGEVLALSFSYTIVDLGQAAAIEIGEQEVKASISRI